ncbi:CPK24 [Symbiodinium necroappetens]|uniref:CPK24 protein n=1 Tax=Symbiodinium necroappetens TaxID=1628268 RepID=A0A812TYR0_9DINO|nr:CPK24 [Symbiodinium necroappetens]
MDEETQLLGDEEDGDDESPLASAGPALPEPKTPSILARSPRGPEGLAGRLLKDDESARREALQDAASAAEALKAAKGELDVIPLEAPNPYAAASLPSSTAPGDKLTLPKLKPKASEKTHSWVSELRDMVTGGQREIMSELHNHKTQLTQVGHQVQHLDRKQEDLSKAQADMFERLNNMEAEVKELRSRSRSVSPAPPHLPHPDLSPRSTTASTINKQVVDDFQVVIGGWEEAKRAEVENEIRTKFARVELLYTDQNFAERRRVQSLVINALKTLFNTYYSSIPGQQARKLWITRNRSREEREKIRALVSIKEWALKHTSEIFIDLDWRGRLWIRGEQVLYWVQNKKPSDGAMMLTNANGDETGWWVHAPQLGLEFNACCGVTWEARGESSTIDWLLFRIPPFSFPKSPLRICVVSIPGEFPPCVTPILLMYRSAMQRSSDGSFIERLGGEDSACESVRAFYAKKYTLPPSDHPVSEVQQEALQRKHSPAEASPITDEEIAAAVACTKTSTSSGLDSVCYAAIRTFHSKDSQGKLRTFFDRILTGSIDVPRDWVTGKICLIPKAGQHACRPGTQAIEAVSAAQATLRAGALVYVPGD